MKIAAFGEIMLRLKSPHNERFLQSPVFEATFAGSEANVAVSLSNFGLGTRFISVLPDNDIAKACLRELQGFGVDISQVSLVSDGRMGAFFLETGANQRPGKVIYDRGNSSLAAIKPGDIDYEKALKGCAWLHISGITPAISESAAKASFDLVKVARSLNLHISCDLNFRHNLWKYGKSAPQVMKEIIPFVDTVIANEEDFQKSLGIHEKSVIEGVSLDLDYYQKISMTAMKQYPNLKLVAITLRESISADHNIWSACMYDGNNFYVSRRYDITDIIDRVGSGDSFSGAFIFGLNHYPEKQQALEFAAAASCLKHSIPGDYNRVSIAEVEALMNGSGSGRVQR